MDREKQSESVSRGSGARDGSRAGNASGSGRTRSMVPSRAESSRSSTPQPSAGRMQFRPVIPQRRRPSSVGPSTNSTDDQQAAKSSEDSSTRLSARPRVRPPMEMTASGPFALGPTHKPSSSRATAAHRPALNSQASSSLAGLAKSSTSVPDSSDTTPLDLGTGLNAHEDDAIDIHDVHQLDARAPQPLLKAPPQFKRERPEVKEEAMDIDQIQLPTHGSGTEEVNHAQALDLSESEDEEGEDELAGRFASSIEKGESDDRIFLMQFPRPFPQFRTTPNPPAKVDLDDQVQSVEPTQEPPEKTQGQIGEMQIYRSGRAVLTIGGIPYEITSGCETSFLQQVMLLDPEQQLAVCLGELNAKMVATPDLTYLLEHAQE
ncbi:hypothetical protein MPSI1_002903 [Malassezia psittaci]|uniref:DNA-directed RNA polymerase III subunit RPC4 n=1 Tax=Malassezia psittaci TaxID=1821823 RepID=A0AAF0FBI6_9BASI|nr:hypothetical protein MPSI1_002903 [Malassezia psittaci]